LSDLVHDEINAQAPETIACQADAEERSSPKIVAWPGGGLEETVECSADCRGEAGTQKNDQQGVFGSAGGFLRDAMGESKRLDRQYEVRYGDVDFFHEV
jgi:hypothetical protein